jgi:hypothetical protein
VQDEALMRRLVTEHRVGLALLSTIASAHTRDALASGVAGPRALTDGFALAFEIGAGFCLAGALVAVALLRARPAPSAVTTLTHSQAAA